MQLEHIFSSFLVRDEPNIDNDSVLRFCDSVRDSAYINETQQYHLTLQEEPLQELYGAISQRLEVMNGALAIKDSVTHSLFNAWINFENPDNITKPHNHSRQFLTVVYYAHATEDSGRLVLVNPNAAHTYVFPTTERDRVVSGWNQFNSYLYNIQPKTGMLVMFPSWLTHYVVGGTRERISIAFNTRLYAGSYDLSV